MTSTKRRYLVAAGGSLAGAGLAVSLLLAGPASASSQPQQAPSRTSTAVTGPVSGVPPAGTGTVVTGPVSGVPPAGTGTQVGGATP
jgi:hypothetical protein